MPRQAGWRRKGSCLLLALGALLAPVPGLRADQAGARFAAAAADYDSRRWQPAAEGFESFLKEFPHDRRRADATLFLGEARLRLGQFDEARREYQRYLKLEPKGKHARAATFRAAEAAYFAGKYDLARPELEQFQTTRPDDSLNAYVLCYLGDIAAAGNDAAAAARFYRESVKQFPNGPLVEDCRRGLRKALAKLADVDRAKMGKPDSAEPQNVLRRDTAETIYDRAWALMGQGKAEEAVRLFERLHEHDRQSVCWADVTLRLAQRASQRSEWAKARGLVDEVLAAKTAPPVREAALYLQAQLAATSGDWPAAHSSFTTLLGEFPRTKWKTAARFAFAEADYQQGDLASAADRLAQLAKETQRQRETWMGMIALRRAETAARQGHWDDAGRLAATIERDFPDFPRQAAADYLLGRCLSKEARFDDARRSYRKVIAGAAGPNAAMALKAQWMIAESFFDQKNYHAAEREYQRLETLCPDRAWQAAALVEMAKCQELLGQASVATETNHQVLKLAPGTPWAAQASERLEQLEKAANASPAAAIP